MNDLLLLAILPVIGLAYFIYRKDTHKEPMKLLRKLFILGFLSAFPVIFVELILGNYFPTEGLEDLISIFIAYFIGVGLVEEFFKWIIVKLFTYNDKEFDEIYDIIVYSVFVSLGFACIENIMYVTRFGYINAILRAITSIPGHTCFGVIMGYYYSKAKVSQISNNKKVSNYNLVLSLLIPAIIHTLYDSILSYISGNGGFILFVCFDVFMVIYCFNLVNKCFKVQQNLYKKEHDGVIREVASGIVDIQKSHLPTTYCPVCGNYVKGAHYCSYCGYKVE